MDKTLRQKIERLTAERDKAQQDCESYCCTIDMLTAERDTAEAYAKRLRGAINGMGPSDVDRMMNMEKELARLYPEADEQRRKISALTIERDTAESHLVGEKRALYVRNVMKGRI